jgi:four helix bundle protein
MQKAGYAKSFRDLIGYKKTRQLAKDIFQVSLRFPKDEMHSLTDQIRRASRSVGAQIAEAWAKRRYEKHFMSKLTDADGEQNETQHWIEIALDCGYLDQRTASELLEKCTEIGRILGGMMDKSSEFCQDQYSKLHEPEPDYIIHDAPDAEILESRNSTDINDS